MSRRTTDFSVPETTLSEAAYVLATPGCASSSVPKTFSRIFLGNGKQFLELQKTQRIILFIYQGNLVAWSRDEIIGNVQQILELSTGCRLQDACFRGHFRNRAFPMKPTRGLNTPGGDVEHLNAGFLGNHDAGVFREFLCFFRGTSNALTCTSLPP